MFQHTATRRWLLINPVTGDEVGGFNTQPPEGGCTMSARVSHLTPFQHTATRRWLPPPLKPRSDPKSFNTQPPEGGCLHHVEMTHALFSVSTHSHPKVAAFLISNNYNFNFAFQHTATRRWLHGCRLLRSIWQKVSTHSHPKVAAKIRSNFA